MQLIEPSASFLDVLATQVLALRQRHGARLPLVPMNSAPTRDPTLRLAASGTLDALLGARLRYAFVSNSDNLGALADVRIAAWLAAEQVPFALEAVRGKERSCLGQASARTAAR